jgi:PAS domain S-box-containing protein
MTSRTPPTDLPDNQNGKESFTELHNSEIAPYWLSAIIDSADDAIITKTLDGIITSWNKGAEHIFGYTAQEAIGQPITMLIPEDLRNEEPTILARLRKGERIEHYETIRVRKDGRLVNISLTVSPIRKPDGTIIGASKIARDITERKRAEAQQLQLAAIVENSDDAIISKDLNGIILSWNPGAERLYGYTAEEIVGQSVTKLIPEGRPDEEPRILDKIRRGEPVDHYETVRVRKDGKFIEVSLTVSPVKDASGRIIGASKIARDITARKRAQEQLREQAEIIDTVNRLGQTLGGELNLHNLVQAVTDAATELTGAHFGSFFYNVLDGQGASYMLYTLSGVPREAFAHFPMPRATDLFGPTFRGEGILRIDDVSKDPRYGKNSPYYGMPEGHLPVTSYLALPVISRTGEVLGGLFFGHPEAGVFTARHERILTGMAAQAAVAMDNARLFEELKSARIEAERAAEENERLYREAQESNRIKDEFLATVSHELRTPLTAILGWAHLLRKGTSNGDYAAKAFETIERNARAQSQLIDDLLDVSRIITGKLRIDVQPIDPNTFIEAAIESIKPGAEAKGVRLQKIVDTGMVFVAGDPVRLQQVIWNLLANAVKFTPRGGRVQVKLERVNSHVEISVSDTGAGIAAEFLPLVFDRFRQADQRKTRQHGGLGLGLSIVRHLVELHGGHVRAASPGEGHGSTFTVFLPVAPVYQADAESGRVHPAARDTLPTYEFTERLDGLRILVVDDEPDTRELLKAGLGQCGAAVTVAGSASEAYAVLQDGIVDLLISDIGMPGEDGYELIRRVRQLPAENGGKVPAIALTAYARVEDRMQALRAGYQMHVPKPIELAELVAVAMSLVQRGG